MVCEFLSFCLISIVLQPSGGSIEVHLLFCVAQGKPAISNLAYFDCVVSEAHQQGPVKAKTLQDPQYIQQSFKA